MNTEEQRRFDDEYVKDRIEKEQRYQEDRHRIRGELLKDVAENNYGSYDEMKAYIKEKFNEKLCFLEHFQGDYYKISRYEHIVDGVNIPDLGYKNTEYNLKLYKDNESYIKTIFIKLKELAEKGGHIKNKDYNIEEIGFRLKEISEKKYGKNQEMKDDIKNFLSNYIYIDEEYMKTDFYIPTYRSEIINKLRTPYLGFGIDTDKILYNNYGPTIIKIFTKLKTLK